MTEMEKRIHDRLARAGGRGLCKTKLRDEVGWWNPNGAPMTDNCLDAHISHMRKKGVGIERVTVYRLVRFSDA